MRSWLWLVYALAGLLAGGAFLAASGTTVGFVAYGLVTLSAVAAVALGVRLHRPADPRPWWLFAAGLLCSDAGDLLTAAYQELTGALPLPSWADLAYLASYPCFGIGLWLMLRRRRPGRDLASLIDATILAVGVGTLAWVVLVAPAAVNPSLGLPAKLVAIAYPVADLALLAIAARLTLVGTRAIASDRLLGVAVGAMLVADVFFGVAKLSGRYEPGDATGGSWLLSYLAFGAAALHPSMRALSERGLGPRVRLTRGRLAALVAATLVGPAILAVDVVAGLPGNLLVVAAASALLALLAVVRIWGMGARLEAALARSREAEARFRTLVEQLPVMVYQQPVADPLRAAYVSPQVGALFGYAPDEWGVSWADRLHPDDRERVLAEVARTDASGEPFRIEYRERTRDGRFLWVRDEATLVRDETGVPRYWLGVKLDVTEQRETEAALQASGARQRALLEALPDLVFRLDRDGTYLDYKADRAADLATTPDGFLGRTVSEVLPPAVAAPIQAAIDRVLAWGGIETVGYALDLAHGRRDFEARLVAADPEQVVAVVREVTERMRTEEALRESEERFRGAFAAASIGIALVAPDGRWLQANPALCKIVGYDADELLAKTFQDLTHPDDLDADLVAARRLLAGEIESYHVEKRYRRKDGAIVWVLLSVSLVRDGQGQPRYFVSQIQDITPRKAAEAALAAERDLLETLMAHLPDTVYVKDTASRFLRLNAATARHLGCDDPTAAIGKTDFDFFPPSLARRYFADEQRVVATGQPILDKLEPQSEDEEGGIWYRTSTVPLRDAEGRVAGIVGSARDVTEQRRAEEALREAEARYRALVEQTPAAVYTHGLEPGTGMTYVSPRIAELLGYTPEEVLARPELFGEEVHPDDRAASEAADARATATGETFDAQYRVRHADGHWVWLRDQARLVRDERGRPLNWQGVLTDLAQLKQQESALRRAKEAAEAADHTKSRFLSMATHELRTPLTAIRGYVDLLLDGSDGLLTDDQRESLQVVEASAHRLAALVDDLLDLARIEAGRLDLDIRPVDVAEVADQIRATVAPEAAAKGISVTATLSSDLPVVAADPDRLYQVLLNLVANAVKFTDRGGVTIAAGAGDGWLEIEVVDTGSGIAPESLPYVFEEFRQAGGAGRSRRGAGLGLAIARRLVELHGGTIAVASVPGDGSRFVVRLPLGGPDRSNGAGPLVATLHEPAAVRGD